MFTTISVALGLAISR